MSIAETYEKLLCALPGELRNYGRTLPHRLGLTATERGQWTDFVELEPNRYLPRLVADELEAEGLHISREVVAAFVEAHHAGGFAMLVADRIADGQVALDPELITLRRLFLNAWAEVLGRALGARSRGRNAVASLAREWRAGISLERRLFGRRAEWQAYARSCRLKLRWVSGTTALMLDHIGLPMRARALTDGYTRLLFALQCRDDLRDAVEDRRTRGASIAEVLDVPPGALMRAAPLAGRRAAGVLRSAGFPRLASWADRYFDEVDGVIPGAVPMRDQVFGMSLAASFEEQNA